MSGKNKTESKTIIDEESKRLKNIQIMRQNDLAKAILQRGVNSTDLVEILEKTKSAQEFVAELELLKNEDTFVDIKSTEKHPSFLETLKNLCSEHVIYFLDDLNDLRVILGLPEVGW